MTSPDLAAVMRAIRSIPDSNREAVMLTDPLEDVTDTYPLTEPMREALTLLGHPPGPRTTVRLSRAEKATIDRITAALHAARQPPFVLAPRASADQAVTA